MKKLLFLGLIALTGCLWADRTANQGWVAKNFAPSNLVTRVKALEDAPAPTESDPVFTAWKTNASVAVGAGAVASGAGAVQIGTGTNAAGNTLQFRDYTVIDASGSIPVERLGSVPGAEADPMFGVWQSGECLFAGQNASASSTSVSVGRSACSASSGVAIGSGAVGGETGCVGIGAGASSMKQGSVSVGAGSSCMEKNGIAIGNGASSLGQGAVQIGSGSNSASNTLQFRDYTVIDANGKIPPERLTASAVLTAIQAMTAEQKAALKTALGL